MDKETKSLAKVNPLLENNMIPLEATAFESNMK
jgi:hypothetical protein